MHEKIILQRNVTNQVMQQVIIRTTLFCIGILSFTLYGMEVRPRGYNLTVKQIPDVADKLTVKITQWSPGPKQVSTFVADFNTHTCHDEQNIIGPFDAAHKHFTHPNDNRFVWDIPNFGLIQLQPDGTMFFGHDPNSAPLQHDYLRLNTPGKLFLENLHVYSLRTKPKETHLRQALTTDKLWVDAGTTFYNHGQVTTNQIGNGGKFVNKGQVNFEGTAEKPALLRIWEFHNDVQQQNGPRPTVRATHLKVTETNQTFDNAQGALCEVSEQFVAVPFPECYGRPSVFRNNGECKVNATDIQRELSGNSKITVYAKAPQYYLTVKQLSAAGKFAVQMSKTLQGNKEICSLITDFSTNSYYKERNMSVLFNTGHQKGFDNNAASNFLWDIPELGLITLQRDGSVLFGHDPITTQLERDEFTIRTTGKLFLNMLRVGKLTIKSPETYISNCVVADQVHVDRTVYNHAALKTKQLMGNGEFINQGRVEFEGSQEELVQLGITSFTNDKHNPRDPKPQPNVTAGHLRITETCERVRNEKGALFDVAELMVKKATSDNSFLYNKGAVHARKLDAQRKLVNRGFMQADSLQTQRLENQKSGRVKIFSRLETADLTNEGEIISKFMQIWQGTNKGTITGQDLTLRVGSDMKNYGNIRLCQLSGCGHVLNRKELLFNDNSRIVIKSLMNYGLLKASSLQLNQTELGNALGGVVELFGKSAIGNATITNNGIFAMEGDTDFSATTLWNKKQMSSKAGKITCIDTRLSNKDTGTWSMEKTTFAHPFQMDNEGVLELTDSSLHFERMRNYKDLTIRGGTCSFKKLINSGNIQTDLLHLTPEALLQNLQDGSVQVFEKSIIDNAGIINDGNCVMQGETNFILTRIYNRNTMAIRQGTIDCTHMTLRNLATGKWLMERMKSVQPIRLVNDGIFEFAQSSLDFNKIQNNNDLVLHSGSYRVNVFKNKQLQLVDNDWAITNNPASPAENKLVLTKLNITNVDLGNIQGEHKITYNLAVLPTAMQAADIDLSDRLCTLQELQAVATTGKVIARCSPEQLAQGDIAFPNIGHLELHVTGPLIKYGSLKAPALTLHVQGALSVGKSNTELGIIAATHGPLMIEADSINGSYAQLYGKGKTDIIATKGYIQIGWYTSGIDEGIKQQAMDGLLSVKNQFGLAMHFCWHWNVSYPYYVTHFDYSLSVRNGAYVASDDFLTFRAANKISVYYGALFSALGVSLIAPIEVTNAAGNISSQGPITIESNLYNHIRSTYAAKNSFYHGMNGHTEYPGSVAAMLESVDKITFKTKKIHNCAGSIRSAKNIIVNDITIHEPEEITKPGTGYVEEPQTFYYRGTGGWCNVPFLTQSCTVQAGKTIQMNLGTFVVTGNMNAPGILMFASTGLFANSCMTRDTQDATRPRIVDVTQFMRQEAQQPGFYRLDAQGAVQTQFPFGVPSTPHAGDLVALTNPAFATPLNWQTIFNPLSSVNLDLHLQRLLSEFAGKVYAGNARGKQSATVLWGNANRWRQQHGKEIMSPTDLQQINTSMLLAQIAHNGMTEEQRMLLCIAPQDINPHQAQGDIVADEFVCVTEHDQTHLNNRIIAQGPQGITLQSQAGNVNLQTQSYTTQYHVDGSNVIEQCAYPQQQLIAQAGPVNVTAHQNVQRIGTAIAAGTHVHEHAQTGSVIKQPLVLQKIVEKTDVEDGLFSSKTTITTNLSHSILPSTTVAGTILHDRAGSSIHAVAPQDAAGQEIIYESPNTVIEGIIVANSTTTKTSTRSMFSDTSHCQSQESPCAMPATIQAPVVRLVGDTARINANIVAQELHDNTVQGAQFVAKVKEMLYSQQTLVDSPFMSVDAGCKGGYEVMIPPMLVVERIIRANNNGHMLFESVIMDRDRTEIIGNFIQTTYQLKQWQETWCNKDQMISDEMLVVIAIAIVIATDGMGAELLALTAESLTAAAMVNAGFSTICAAAGTTLLKTGDPVQMIEQLGSTQFLKSLAIDVASAGLCSKLGGMLNVNMASGVKPLVSHVQEHALRTTVDTLLQVAINCASVDQALGNACKQIPLKAIAAYVANNICTSYLDNIGQKVAHTALGGATGFATQGNKKGFISGAVGALTAQTVGDLLTADACAISDAAIMRLKNSGQPLTQENINKAIDKEIAYRMKIAKITAGTVAALAKLNPSIAMQTAANVIDNDMAIRAQIYAMTEMQRLLTAATQAVAHLEIPAQAAPRPAAAKTTQKRNKPIKRSLPQDRQSDLARDILLYALEKPVDTYGDLIMQCAQEWQPHNYAQEKKRRSLMDRIVNPEKSPFIEETSEIISTAFKEAIKNTVNTFAYIPNPVGLACFAAETGYNVYQGETTPGEVIFNMAAAYGVLKGIQYTGRGITKLYKKGKDAVTDSVLNHLHQRRYAAQGRVPFVPNPRSGQWPKAAISGDIVLDSDLFGIIYKQKIKPQCRIDQAAPFNVAAHGNPFIIQVSTNRLHPKALSKANLKILKKEGAVALNEVQLARLIVTAPGYKKGQHVNLFSCQCGAQTENIAQRLSMRMGVPVSAFTESVAVSMLRTSFRSYSVKTGKKGVMKTFYPEPMLSSLTPLVVLPAFLLSGSTRMDHKMKLFDIRNNSDNYYDNHEDSYPLDSSGVEDNSEHNEQAHDANHTEQRPFVQNPERGIWIKGCISGDLMLEKGLSKLSTLFLKYNTLDKDEKCPFTVFAHGSPSSVLVEAQDIHPGGLSSWNEEALKTDGYVHVNARELKRLIETATGYKPGQHVHIFSCLGGADSEGIAQQLADEMQVSVSAFTGYAGAPIIGGFFSSTKGKTLWSGLKEIKTFEPRSQQQRRITNLEGAFGFAH